DTESDSASSAPLESSDSSATDREHGNRHCPRCKALLSADESSLSNRVCGACGYHDRESARAAILRLVDRDSFREQDTGLTSTDPLRFEDETIYSERLLRLREETGESD